MGNQHGSHAKGGVVIEETLESMQKEKQRDEHLKNLEFKIIPRNEIKSGMSGPMIILESTAVTYVDENYNINTDGLGNLILNNKEN